MRCSILTALFLLVFGWAAGAAVLEVAETASTPGAGGVPVGVYISPEGASISALQFDMVFDASALTFQTSPAPTRGDATIATAKSFAVQVVDGGRIRVVVAGGQSLLPAGTLGTVFFSVASDAAGALPITIENALASNPWGLPVSLVLAGGAILLPSPQRLPIADFSGTPRSGVAPFTVSFTDLSDPTDGVITSWLWDFGDGESSLIADAFHTYDTPGVFDVRLTVTATHGTAAVSKPGYITVFSLDDAPTADFTASPTSGAPPLSVQFLDQSLDGASAITGWQWDFGDGDTSTLENPAHLYAQEGAYDVTLTVYSASGADELTSLRHILVQEDVEGPTANFQAVPTTGDAPLEVSFADQSTPGTRPIVTWLWDFGDGATSSARNPFHTYAESGDYDVSLVVSTEVGSDSVTYPALITVTGGAEGEGEGESESPVGCGGSTGPTGADSVLVMLCGAVLALNAVKKGGDTTRRDVRAAHQHDRRPQ